MKKYLLALTLTASATSGIFMMTTTGLVGYWKFDENSGTQVVDSSSTGANGSIRGGATWTAGNFGSALSFDGIDDYVKIAHKGALMPKESLWTVSAWVKTSLGNGTIVRKGDSSRSDEYKLSLIDGYLRFTINAGGDSVKAIAKGTSIVSDGKWHHVVGVRSAKKSADVYVDGIKEGSASYSDSGVSIDARDVLTIGGRKGGRYLFTGMIDDVQIYNRALSATEIATLGGSSPSPTVDTASPVLSGGLPSGVLAYGTISATLSVTTNENATCRYSQIAGTAYASMTDTFSVTGGTTHTKSLSGLTNGTAYTYYVRCVDMAGNINTSDYTITFSVSSTPPATVACVYTYPAQMLDLINWKETLPIGSSGSPTEIKQPALATYTNDPYFKINAICNGVQFRAPVNGVTTSGSSYPRSELREMTSSGTVNASWSTTFGVHTMTIDEAITAVPKTKKHVVAGQIHDSADDVIVIRLEYPKLFIDINGTAGPVLDANYVLGKRFTVQFVAGSGQISIYYNGSTTPAYTLNKSGSGMYFKAGAYTQSNCTKELSSDCVSTNYGEVMIYSLNVVHTTSP